MDELNTVIPIGEFFPKCFEFFMYSSVEDLLNRLEQLSCVQLALQESDSPLCARPIVNYHDHLVGFDLFHGKMAAITTDNDVRKAHSFISLRISIDRNEDGRRTRWKPDDRDPLRELRNYRSEHPALIDHPYQPIITTFLEFFTEHTNISFHSVYLDDNYLRITFQAEEKRRRGAFRVFNMYIRLSPLYPQGDR